MIIVLTQSGAIVKINDLTTISVILNDDNKYLIVADQNYILGSYDNETAARDIIVWMAHSIGDCTEPNLCITMPIVVNNEENDNAEND